MKNIFICILISASCPLWSQNELPSGQIEVIKDFEVRLTETKKIRIVPQPSLIDSSARRYEYKLLAPSPSIEYLTPVIKPLAIQPEQKPTYYPFFAKAGYGNPNSLLAKVSYDHVVDESMQWGLDLSHLSAHNKKIPLQKFSATGGRVNANYLLNEYVHLEGYIDGKVENHYFYGAEFIPSNPDALKRTYNRYDAYFKLSKQYDPSSRLRYNAILQYLFDKDNLGSRENGLKAGGEIASSLGADEFPLGLKALADLSSLKHTEEMSVDHILLTPYFKPYLGALNLHLGGTILFERENREILPDFNLSYALYNGVITLKAGWDSEVEKNNFHFLSAYNPYIHVRLDSVNAMISRRYYAGVSIDAGKFVLDVSGGYTAFEGMAFFLQDEDEETQFNPVYDDGSYIGIQGSVRYELLKRVFLRTQVSQRFYSLDHEEKPWHRPSLGINGLITYAGEGDAYHLSFIFHGENGLPYRTVGGTESRLDPLVDINLHGDYYLTNSIGVFAEVNNILGNNRERWVTYPSFGFNAKAGVLFRFP